MATYTVFLKEALAQGFGPPHASGIGKGEITFTNLIPETAYFYEIYSSDHTDPFPYATGGFYTSVDANPGPLPAPVYTPVDPGSVYPHPGSGGSPPIQGTPPPPRVPPPVVQPPPAPPPPGTPPPPAPPPIVNPPPVVPPLGPPVTPPPITPPPVSNESPNGTIINSVGPTIIDALGNVWSLST